MLGSAAESSGICVLERPIIACYVTFVRVSGLSVFVLRMLICILEGSEYMFLVALDVTEFVLSCCFVAVLLLPFFPMMT